MKNIFKRIWWIMTPVIAFVSIGTGYCVLHWIITGDNLIDILLEQIP